MIKTIHTGLIALTAAALFVACSSESYPGLEYDNPNSVTNDETPDENSGLPIHVYVNEQAVFSLTSSGVKKNNITRGVGAFQIDADEDIAKRREEIEALRRKMEEGTITPKELEELMEKEKKFKEDTTLMRLKQDTTTFYIYAFRDRAALNPFDEDTKRVTSDPDLHRWYQMAEHNIPADAYQDAQRLDCLIDGYDYNKGLPSTIVEENKLDMKIPKTSHLYWGEYQGISYNFFAYSVGDINRGDDDHIQWGTPHRSSDRIWYENFAIDGSQDLMVGYAPPLTADMFDEGGRYHSANLTKDEQRRIINDGSYTSFAAHRNIEPEIDLKHQLTRLRFHMLPGDSTSTYTTIDTVYATSPYKGDFVVAVNSYKDVHKLGFYPDPYNVEKLYLHERPKLDDEGHLLPSRILGIDSDEERSVPWSDNYWVRDDEGTIIGKLPLSERGKPVTLGDALLIPESEEIVISIKTTYKKEQRPYFSHYVINAKSQAGNDPNNDKYFDNDTGTFKFKRGYIYDITLVVYGLQDIEVTANIEAWKDGGVIIITPDDAESQNY